MRDLHLPADLDAAVARSRTRPIVIFKHSSQCGTSAMALEEIEMLMADDPTVEIYVVSVQTSAPLSAEIAARLGVRHESPQALVVRDGVVTWRGSHFRVTRDNVAAALARSASSSAPRSAAGTLR